MITRTAKWLHVGVQGFIKWLQKRRVRPKAWLSRKSANVVGLGIVKKDIYHMHRDLDICISRVRVVASDKIERNGNPVLHTWQIGIVWLYFRCKPENRLKRGKLRTRDPLQSGFCVLSRRIYGVRSTRPTVVYEGTRGSGEHENTFIATRSPTVLVLVVVHGSTAVAQYLS